jgi:hypothetical protein
MSKPTLGRTSFRYDMMPWKLVFCALDPKSCSLPDPIYINDLPDAPEPGRVPEGCDHLHITVKLSGDQRNAREEEKWHSLLVGTARCEHGRVARDACKKCPGKRAPDVVGKRIGTAHDGEAICIPEYDDMAQPQAWVPNRKRNV